MKNQILILIFLCSFAGIAQEKDIDTVLVKTSKLPITDFYLMPGLSLSANDHISVEDFRKFNPDSKMLKNDFSSYEQIKQASLNVNAQIALKISLKLNEKKNQHFQLGILHSTYNDLSTHYTRTIKKRFDTLTSTQTGQTLYSDSVYISNYNITYEAKYISLTAALLFRTNEDARWGLYSGVGLTAGVSYKALTTILMNDYYGIETRKTNGELVSNSFFNIGNGYKNEYLRNKPSFQFMVNVPMGIDFKMGKKKEFFKRMHLFYELQPAFQINVLPKIEPKFSVLAINTLGLRVSF